MRDKLEVKEATMVALSTTEAEYIAISASVRQYILLRELGKILVFYESGPMIIMGDNSTTIGMTREPKISDASNHIAIQYHHTREVVKNGVVKVQNFGSEENTADILTKGLARVLHEKHTLGMGMETI